MNRIAYSLVSILLSSIALAQSNTNVTLPSNPGMSIIGVQTSEFSEPGNYSGLYANLISPIIANNGTVPSDLSIEFSPFYLSNEFYTLDEIDEANLYRDLKISIASTQVNNDSLGTFSRMGIGFQTYIYGGKITDKYKNVVYSNSFAGNIATIINDLTEIREDETIPEDFIEYWKEHHFEKFPEEIQEQLEELFKKSPAQALTGVQAIEDQLKPEEVETSLNAARRNGSFLQLAGAFSLDFPENSFSYSNVERWGIWLDYTHQWIDKSESKYALSFITRVSNYSFDPTVLLANNPLFFDAGIGIYFDIPSQRLLIKGEYVGKLGLSEIQLNEDGSGGTFSSSTESKWSFSIGYKLPDDNTVLSFSLSDVNANADYVQNQATQFLLGLSTALVTQKPE